MEDLARQFHFTIYNPIFMQDPLFPDMRMLPLWFLSRKGLTEISGNLPLTSKKSTDET